MENKLCQEVDSLKARMHSAVPNGKRGIELASRQNKPHLRSDGGGRATGARGRSDAVAELISLQAEYIAWLDALPEALQETPTAEALRAVADLDLDDRIAIEPPRGYGRD